MRVVIFFVCLCYLLVGGYNYIHTGTHLNSARYFTARQTEDPRQQKFINKQDHAVVKKVHSSQGGEALIGDNVEDEETSLFARKYKLLARGYLALSALLLLGCSYQRMKGARPFFHLFPNKYITLGVLRI